MSESARGITPANDDERHLRDEVLDLVLQIANDRPVAPAISRLDSLLRKSAAARSSYLDAIELRGRLLWESRERKRDLVLLESPSLLRLTDDRSRKDTALRRAAGRLQLERVPFRLAAASIVLVSAFWTFWAYLIHSGQNDAWRRNSEQSAVATLTSSAECRWEDKSEPIARNGTVPVGQPIKLSSGLAELKLGQGTTLLVKGPAHWTIDGSNQATVFAGRLIARVPKSAIGFSLKTPTTEIVDLGTEFGVTVDSDGTTEVHVLKGVVLAQASNSASKSRKLSQGEAIRVERVAGQDTAELSIVEFADRSFAAMREQHRKLQPNSKNETQLLEYKFNETGVASRSTGHFPIPIEFRNIDNAPADLHSAPGLGVAGDLKGHSLFRVDRSFDNTASTGMGWPGQRGGVARHSLEYNEIDGLTSFTLSGWFKTASSTPIQNGARLFNNADGDRGFFLNGDLDADVSTTLYKDRVNPAVGMVPGRNGAGGLRLHVDSDRMHCSSYGSAGYRETQTWIFFAATYDGTRKSDNVKFYKGYRKADECAGDPSVTLIATRTFDEGPVADDPFNLGIGNRVELDRPFDGYLDNIRLDGSRVDGSGALNVEQLENRRSNDMEGP